MDRAPSRPGEENSWESDVASEQGDAKTERADVESDQRAMLRMERAGAALSGVLVLLILGAISVIERDSDAPATGVDPSASVDLLAAPVWRPPWPLVAAPPPTIVARQPPAQLPRPDRPTATPPAPHVPSATPPPSPLRSAERSPSPPPRTATVDPPRRATTEPVPGPLPRVAVDDPALVLSAPPPPATAPSPAAVPTPLTPPSLAAASTPSSSSRTAEAEIDAETGAIHNVLGRYRSALSALDSKAVQQVWPTVNQRTLVRAFGQVQEQDVTFVSCAIDVKGGLAQALCVGTTNFVPKVGKRSSQFGPSQWNVSLRKEYSGAWQIQEVQAR